MKKKINHQIDVVIDRLKINQEIKQRITESIETGLKLTDGKILALDMETEETRLFSSVNLRPVSIDSVMRCFIS